MIVKELIQELLKYDTNEEFRIVAPDNTFLTVSYIAFNKVQNAVHINTDVE